MKASNKSGSNFLVMNDNQHGLLTNIQNAKTILTLHCNAGKATVSRVTINTCNELPMGMLEEHGDMTLAVDIMYINEIPFVMRTSQAINFRTAELIKNK